jgi:hypothetical protein
MRGTGDDGMRGGGKESSFHLPRVREKAEGNGTRFKGILWNIEQYNEVGFAHHTIQGFYRSRGFTQGCVIRVPAGGLTSRC